MVACGVRRLPLVDELERQADPVGRTQDPESGSVRFRDPESPEVQAAPLRRAIAQVLVGAPSLPVPLPAARMTLLDVEADASGIELVLGSAEGTGPALARLRLVEDHGVVSVTVRSVVPAAEPRRALLEVLATRVARAVTAEKWAAASASARELRKLPLGIPLSHLRQIVPGIEPMQGLVRTGFRCNQDCGLCWQGREWGQYGSEQILRWIEDLREAGARALLISGGEPTLDPQLERYVERARAIGMSSVVLETNAVQLAKPGHAARLAAAGVTSAFVSLHSGDAAVSDAITRAPGTHVRTVRGIRALLEADIPVMLNAVMTKASLATLGRLPDFIHDAFGGHPGLRSLMISYPTDPFDRGLVPDLMPDLLALRAPLAEAIERAHALGIELHGLDGPCGPPLCAFGADRRVTTLRPVPAPLDFRVHVPACEGCAVKTACFGVRRADAESHGDACVSPIAG